MIQAIYGLGTLLCLWAFAGGNIETLGARSSFLAVGLALLAIIFYANPKNKQKTKLKVRPQDLKIAVPAAILATVASIAVVLVAKQFPAFQSYIAQWKLLPVPGILLLALIAQPAAEYLTRTFLQPAWGLGSVAFLDAITVGFGLAHVLPFLLMLGASYFFGFLFSKYSLGASVVARTLWTLLFLLALRAL